MHFNELVKGICRSFTECEKTNRSYNHSILVSEKLNLVREKSVKSQGILFLFEGGHPEVSVKLFNFVAINFRVL